MENKARRVTAEILYDGNEIGLSGAYCSMSYTDNAEGRSDEVLLSFEDSAKDMLYGKKMILEKGHDIDITLTFRDWEYPGDHKRYHVGKFTVDDISFSGAALTCEVRGISIPADEGFNNICHSQTWSNITLQQLCREFMGRYGMDRIYWYGDDPKIDTLEQSNETDSSFLMKTCALYGMYLKVYKVGLVVFDKKVYEPRPAKAGFGIKDIEQWKWNTTLAGTYTGCNVKYTSPGSNKKEAKVIDVTVGTAPRILYINRNVKDEAEAEKIAREAVNAANEKAVTFSGTVMPNERMYATDNFLISGLGRADGKYFATSVTHSINEGKYSCQLTGYRIFDRL